MEDRKAKQRLVGAIVIVSLAVIFIPMLLNTEDNVNPLLIGSNIPDKPQQNVEVIPLETPPPRPGQKPITVIPVDEQSAPVEADKPEPETTTEKSETRPQSTETTPGAVPEQPLSGWVVQLGSFSKKQNALELRDKARSHGFAAFVEAYSSKNGQRYRVRVGPEISVEKANELKQQIKRKMGTDGLVLQRK
jgi:DedD protein